MQILYIDVETTGFNPVENGIHQIAGIIEINEEVKEEFFFKVRPFPDDVIKDDALDVSGTKKEDLEGYYDPEFVFIMFNDLCSHYFASKELVNFCAHNVDFDYNFMDQWFKKMGHFGFKNYKNKICTKKLAQGQQVKYGWENNKLVTVAEYFGYKFKAHQADEDVKACRFIHQKLNSNYYNDLF